MVDRSKRHLSTNTLDVMHAEQAEPMAFANVITIGEGSMVQGKKCHNEGKGEKRARVAVVSTGVGIQPYTPVKLLSFK